MTTPPVFGLFGKLPARGDFIRTGLPRDFTDPWDEWLQTVLSASREQMRQDWLPAWLEAPVWRFHLAPATCGARSVIGLMLPSVDRAGRYFPLTLAALVSRPRSPSHFATDEGDKRATENKSPVSRFRPYLKDANVEIGTPAESGAPGPETDDWLDACEAAGRAALDHDLLPVQIGELVPPPPPFDSGDPTGTTWWTSGGPRVPASRLTFPALPDAASFVTMLDAEWHATASGAS